MSKVKIVLVLIFIFTVLGVNAAYAVSNKDSIVTFLTVNDDSDFEIEVITDNSREILIPIKGLADILEIPITVNHSTKDVTFKNFSGKSVKATKSDIYVNGQKVNSEKNTYLQIGIMSSTKDEIFSDAKTLSEVFEIKLNINKNDLSIIASSEHKFSFNTDIPSETNSNEPVFKAHSTALIPKPKKRITFDTIELNNSMSSDSSKQIYLNSSATNAMFNNNSQFSLKGEVFSGDYSVDFNTNNYTDKVFSFGGFSFTYKNQFKDGEYELGKVTGFKDDYYSIGTNVIGAQIYNYHRKPLKYNDIEGKVDEKSIVNLYVNDELFSPLSTYGGHYSLKEVKLDNEPYKIRIEEVKENGETKEVRVEEFNKKNNRPKLSAFAGISGINGRLFSQNGQIYQMNTKKFVTGISCENELNERTSTTSRVIFDKIVMRSPNSEKIYYSNSAIFSNGTYQNPNVLEGLTFMNILDYKVNDNLTIYATLTSSSSYDVSTMENLYGFSFSTGGEYQKDKHNLRASLYKQSPKFYLAGSESGFISDRLGGNISWGYTGKKLNFNTHYNKYLSNLKNENKVGLTSFDELSLTASMKLSNSLKARFSGNARLGQNLVGENQSHYYDMNIAKTTKRGPTFELGQRESSYSTEYCNNSSDNFESIHSTMYSKALLKMPKSKGYLSVAHDFVNYSSNNNDNNYSLAKIGYIFPEIKRLTLMTELGYKYKGMDKGATLSVSLNYRAKSDSIISLSYQYGRDNGYLFDNMYIPSNVRHTINLTFNDTFAIMPSGLKSVGYTDTSEGFLEVITYFDKNKNGAFDDGDETISNVPIKASWTSEPMYTGIGGRAPLQSLEKGVYKVGLDLENLNNFLSPARGTRENQLVVISPKRNTQATFAMISSVGNISGKLKVVDDFGRIKSINDFIVVLHDEKDVEVAYSTVDKNGNYYFSGIEPGKYIMKLDQIFINEYNLAPNGTEGTVNINIPYIYKKFVDIKNANLTYKSW